MSIVVCTWDHHAPIIKSNWFVEYGLPGWGNVCNLCLGRENNDMIYSVINLMV